MEVRPRRARTLRRAGAVLLAASAMLLAAACVTGTSSLRPGPYAEPVNPGGMIGR